MSSTLCASAPKFLTRTCVVAPPCLYYQIPRHTIKRSIDPYRVDSRPRRAISEIHRKRFHSSPVAKAVAAATSAVAGTAASEVNNPSAVSSSIPHISQHIAAASSGKGRKYQLENAACDFTPSNDDALGLQKGDDIYKKRRARPDSGQDAYFATRVGADSNVIAFGVADGVGGWIDHGVDPADFSHGICSHMAETALKWPRNSSMPEEKLGPVQLLELGYDATIQDPQIRAGGTTVCVAVTGADGRMHIANLGDSGFLQVRLGTVHHSSIPQTHAFNTPYQLSITPPEILTQAAIFGGLPLNDLPERADVADHMLRHGDVTVLATDGVWDNLSSQDILHIVSQTMRQSGAWQRTENKGYIVTDKIGTLVQKDKLEDTAHSTLQGTIAAKIVGEAKTASLDRKRDGPFAKAMQKEYPYDRWHGGKIDDITALVVISVNHARVAEQQQRQEREQTKAKL